LGILERFKCLKQLISSLDAITWALREGVQVSHITDEMTIHEEIPARFGDEEAFQELVESVYPAIKLIIKYFSLQVQLDFSF
jgi:hypothetical protein